MQLLAPQAITTAQSIAAVGSQFQIEPGAIDNLLLEAEFTYGSGGTSVTAYVQGSLDGGATWLDLACFEFGTSSAKALLNLTGSKSILAVATPTDGSLANNTANDGMIAGGMMLRTKMVTVGTYAASTTLAIYAGGPTIRARSGG